MTYNRHVCGWCRKSFVTDNPWIAVKHPREEFIEVEAYFCSGKCRAHWLIEKGWTLGVDNRLRPPGESE